MRPYRGKTKEGEWVYGWYAEILYTSISNEVKKKHIIYDQFEAIGITIEHEVLPDTVGQSTGLKDRNGKEIYEGDILHIWSKFYKKDMPIATVYWNEKLAEYDVKESTGHYHNWLRNGHKKGWFIEVIGTIHDKEQP